MKLGTQVLHENVGSILKDGTNSPTSWPLVKHHHTTYYLPNFLNVIFHGNQTQESCTVEDAEQVCSIFSNAL